jgi:hypothetical protein
MYRRDFTLELSRCRDMLLTAEQNAVIISAPGSPFIDRWMLSYQDFRPWNYAYNGVMKSLVGVYGLNAWLHYPDTM